MNPNRCIHLCCKAMLVYGESFENDPDYQAGLTKFWCVRSSTGEGPDGHRVSMEQCCNPERECYQEY